VNEPYALKTIVSRPWLYECLHIQLVPIIT